MQGNLKELNKHYHNQLIRKVTKDLEQSIEIKKTQTDQQMASLKSDAARLQSEMATKLQPLIDSVVRVETTTSPTASRRFWRDGFDGEDLAGNLLQWNTDRRTSSNP